VADERLQRRSTPLPPVERPAPEAAAGARDGQGDGRRGQRLPTVAAWWAVPGAGVAVLLSGLGASAGVGLTHSQTSATSDLLGETGLWAAMLGTALFVSHRYGADLRRDYGLAFRSRDVLWGVVAVGCALAVVQGVVVVFAHTRFAGTNVGIITKQKGHEVGFVVVSLVVAVGAPFFEELFFRGFLRAALQTRFGAHGAVWLQAVFFGLAHLGEASTRLGNVTVVLAMVGVGVVFGYTAKLTKRLGAGMVAHCLFNLAAVVSVL